MNPEISVIMPVYNAENFVEQAIDSVLSQSIGNFELIIVDDGSTDSSTEILKQYDEIDSRVRLVSMQFASGTPAAPRNRGLDLAQGRYVALLDSDDIWHSEKLERQLNFMQKMQAVVSYTGYERVSENGNVSKRIHVPSMLSYRDLLKNTAIANSSVMFDRYVAGDERFPIRGHEDYAFWLKLVRKYGKCFGLDEVLMKYRVVGESVSSSKLKSISWVWNIYREAEELSLIDAGWCLLNYGVRAINKRLG